MRTLGQRYAQRSKPKLEKAWDAQGILLRFQFLELEDLALRVIFAPGAAVRLREKETDLGVAGHHAAGCLEFADGGFQVVRRQIGAARLGMAEPAIPGRHDLHRTPQRLQCLFRVSLPDLERADHDEGGPEVRIALDLPPELFE